MDDLAASAGAELYDYLYDYDWNVRMEALERLGKLGPAARAQHAGAVIDTWLDYVSKSSIECRDDDEDRYYVHSLAKDIVLALSNVELAKYADAVVARRPHLSRDMRIETAKMLGRLEPASVARWHDDLAAMLEGSKQLSREALETLAQMEPATLAQYANAIVARLSDSSKHVRNAALETLANLEPATLAQHTEAVVAMIEDSEMFVRTLALATLAKLEPATIAQHAEAVVAMLEETDEFVRTRALTMLHNLEPAALALYAEAVVARLEDSDWMVRISALETLGKLEPAKLAQYANVVVAILEDSDDPDAPPSVRKIRKMALQTLGKLEPPTLARCASGVAAMLDDGDPGVQGAAFDALSALPRYVTRGIDVTSKALRDRVVRRGDSLHWRSQLLGRAAWYRCRLRLRCWRGLALYWSALPYRPSGPGHARDVEAWNLMSGNRDQSSSQATSTSTRETKRQKKARGAQAVGGSSTSKTTSTSTRETRGQKKARGAQAVGGSS